MMHCGIYIYIYIHVYTYIYVYKYIQYNYSKVCVYSLSPRAVSYTDQCSRLAADKICSDDVLNTYVVAPIYFGLAST